MIPFKYLTQSNQFQTVLWNNKLICIDEKSFYFKTLEEKGILRFGVLAENDFIFKRKLRELNISPLEAFRLKCVIDALPLGSKRLQRYL